MLNSLVCNFGLFLVIGGLTTLTAGVNKLTGGLTTLIAGIIKLSAGLTKLTGGLTALTAGLTTRTVRQITLTAGLINFLAYLCDRITAKFLSLKAKVWAFSEATSLIVNPHFFFRTSFPPTPSFSSIMWNFDLKLVWIH